MFTTKPLSSIKNVIPSIHQPLPLSSKDSKKLLDVLKTSFRHNLDKEHGYAPENADSSASKHSSTSHNAHHRPTDRHLRAILSNPLFKNAIQPSNVSFTTPRDPMDVFDEAVSRGMMTRNAATGCLRTKRQQILQSSAIPAHDAMKASAAGLRVVQWLRSSGMERTLDFLKYPHFVHELVPFMVAEGLDEVAWAWADRLIQSEGPAEDNSKIVGSLVAAMVAAKSDVVDKNLDTAFSAMLRADATWKSSPRQSKILLRPWQVLSWRSTVDAWKRPLPSAALFELYFETANRIARPLRLDRAHLELHHPTKPNHESALKFLQSDRLPISESNTGPVPRVIYMGMDAVSHLTRLGRTDEADDLLNLLQSRFSEEIRQRFHSRGIALM
ncbi:hypothetical protein CGRA01v4_10577 [Colletotrichum graminicola]|uniref:Uncharacterized protein n=1 Tax=Colletotrichum graminicola (strain M1.001 / M2 / FGSC 10212) TaxID=645133 RepID=E3QK93_COLGM|nr:uncharacterized protein GLRG_06425 [Colletotrichum graminicola M1.001]EFQ31281.1 hypothetical protein GLRG_06425 [Colletotrichum graminicola M1.001]WDK19290.1 hypothetical protein CGRA01v4_10577 [Colletotrichum graminicola]